MKIFIKTKTGAKKTEVKKEDSSHYNVSVKERPIKGKANLAVIKALAEHFKISRSRIHIISGNTSRNKVVEIAIRETMVKS